MEINRTGTTLLVVVASLLLLGSCAVEREKVHGIVGQSVELPCKCSENFSRLIWQIGEETVLYDSMDSKQNDQVHDNIQRRIKVSKSGSCSLHLSDVSLADVKTYTCYTLREALLLSQYEVQLNVSANYTTHANCTASNAAEVVYECKAAGGFPRGTISWLLNNESLPASVTSSSDVQQDKQTSLYTLTSTLRMQDRRKGVQCVLENTETVPKEIFVLAVHCPEDVTHTSTPGRFIDSPESMRIGVPVTVIILLVVILGVLVLLRRWRQKRQIEPPVDPAVTRCLTNV